MEIDYSDFCSTCGSDIFPETLKLTGTKCAGCRDMVAKEKRGVK
jgi:DNA-directed RNA polymerase subunit RPC12/RpoP